MLKIRGEMHGEDGMIEFAITGDVEIRQHEHGVTLRVGPLDLEMDKETFEVFASEISKTSKKSSGPQSKISSTSRMSKESSTPKDSSKVEIKLEMNRKLYNLLREFCEFTGDDINDWIAESVVYTMGAELDHMMGYPIKKVEKIAKRFVEQTGHPLPLIKGR